MIILTGNYIIVYDANYGLYHGCDIPVCHYTVLSIYICVIHIRAGAIGQASQANA